MMMGKGECVSTSATRSHVAPWTIDEYYDDNLNGLSTALCMPADLPQEFLIMSVGKERRTLL